MTYKAPQPSRSSCRKSGPRGNKARGRGDTSLAPTSCEEALEAVIALAQATMSEATVSQLMPSQRMSEATVSQPPLSEPPSWAVSEHIATDRIGSRHDTVPRRDSLQRDSLQNVGSRHRAPPSPVQHGTPGQDLPLLTAQQQLARALRGLEPELALKLRTLMVAGRDGQSIHAVKIHMTLAAGTSSFHAAADDASENGPLLAEYLRRGHALAHASGLDLERPLAGWSKAELSGDERDWQRFGRQLAQSHPDDWQCLLVAGEAPKHDSQLYLEHPEYGGWSFDARLDRTALAALEDQRRGLSATGSSSVSTRSLVALVPRLRKAQGLAVRRAARAICARVGARAVCARPECQEGTP